MENQSETFLEVIETMPEGVGSSFFMEAFQKNKNVVTDFSLSHES